jgi:hypothetical protein
MKNNTNDPWAQQKWLPGVLNQDQMQSIIDCKLFNVPYPKNARQEMGTSGIDLHISNEGYKLVNGTIKPSSKKSYKKLLSDRDFVEKLTLNKEGYYELLSSESYLFKIKESNLRKRIPIFYFYIKRNGSYFNIHLSSNYSRWIHCFIFSNPINNKPSYNIKASDSAFSCCLSMNI